MMNQLNTINTQSLIRINLFGDHHLFKFHEFFGYNHDSLSLKIIVNTIDSISSIINITNLSYNEIRFIYKNRILCPAFSFAFYKIQNNDNILITQSKRNKINSNNKIISKSSNDYKMNNLSKIQSNIIENLQLENKYTNTEENCLNTYHSDFFTDLYRFKIESNHKKFRKLTFKYYQIFGSDSQTIDISSNDCFVTVLPEKPEKPSTNFLPSLNM